MNKDFLDGLTVNRGKTVTEALKRLYKGVLDLNDMIGLDTSSEPLKGLYKALRQEEVGEIFKAIDEEDAVEFLDGVIDGLVIGSYEYVLKHPKGDVMGINLSEVRLRTELTLLSDIYEDYDISDVLPLLENIFYTMDIDHNKAVDEVLKSNFSKFPTVEEFIDAWSYKKDNEVILYDSIALEIACVKYKGRYDDITTTLVKDSKGIERIIFWAGIDNEKDDPKLASPKYIKPCTFVEPDFGSCLNF